MKKQKKVLLIIRLISKSLGKTKPVVSHPNPFRVLVATLLSTRTKDETTARITKKLFSRYKTPKQLASAPIKKIEKLIYGIGFYKTKARNLKKLSKILIEKYNGKVPPNFDCLVSLPGAGRKVANCTLVYAFSKPAICVDVHCHRIPNRIGIIHTKTPEQTETTLKHLLPKHHWLQINELFVKFGQRCCKPRAPLCYSCPIAGYCKYPKKRLKQ